MTSRNVTVEHSVSTWRQPSPPAVSAERSALVAWMARRVTGLGPGRLLIGIDGLTASGKTSFGHELAEAVARAGRPVLRACLDDFKNPWRDRHRYDRESGEGYYRNAYDYATARELLLDPCRSAGPAVCSLCSLDPLTQIDHAAVTTPVADDAVLIVDGVFAFRPELNAYWHHRIWLDVDDGLSVARGAARDGGDGWAGSEAEALHRDRYLGAAHVYLREVRPLSLADVVIDNRDFAAPRVIVP
ncbi:uridine kinase [Streptomyces sp. NPDC057638]|uniref:uridine kinase n=1 Tax=Streptomyces sp. NPDC057638 TaxID=3346190 RepID=UPI0036A15DF8